MREQASSNGTQEPKMLASFRPEGGWLQALQTGIFNARSLAFMKHKWIITGSLVAQMVAVALSMTALGTRTTSRNSDWLKEMAPWAVQAEKNQKHMSHSLLPPPAAASTVELATADTRVRVDASDGRLALVS